MKTLVSRIDKSTKIEIISNVDATHARDMSGDIVQTVPLIKITAEFLGDWNTSSDRDADMEAAVSKLMESYKAHTE